MKKFVVLIGALALLTSCQQLTQGKQGEKKNESSTTSTSTHGGSSSGSSSAGTSSGDPSSGGSAGATGSGAPTHGGSASSGSSSAGTSSGDPSSGGSTGAAGSGASTKAPKETFTLTFDTGGENTPRPIIAEKDSFVKLPEPTRENREFMGWSEEEGGIGKYYPGYILQVTQHMYLYATWRIIDLSIGGESKRFKNETVFLQGIPVPQDSEWQAVKGFGSDRINIDWKPGHKWYDTDQFTADLCWAATASNIIQWWLDQNAEFIARYKDYTQKHEHTDRYNSDLFKYYQDHFEDKGNRPDLAVVWYLQGLSAKPGGGFFKDVFDGVTLKKNTFFITKGEFNKMIDDALQNGSAISMVANGHATTVWGAHFDADGFVDRIYYTDSADDSKTNHIGLRHIAVTYKKEYDVLKPFMPSSVHGIDIPIAAISTFSLGQDTWRTWLTAHGK